MAVRVKFKRDEPAERQLDLFAPEELWLAPAREWALSQGKLIRRWRIDQCVLIGDTWYKVQWDEQTQRWTFSAV
jgi:hypothetical protein